MRTLALILLMVVLVGCTIDADPMRAAIAHERTSRADNAQSAQVAQISQAQSADADRRNAQTMLQALQAQQAIVQGHAAIAQADAQIAIAISNDAAMIAVADLIVEATQPDYTPLYVGMALVTTLIVAYMLIVVRRTAPEPELVPMPKLLPSPPGTELWLYPNGELQQIWIEPFDSRVLAPGDPMYKKLLTGGKQ